MYICICNAVTDNQIKQAIDSGAKSMHCLSQQLGVGSQCGKCVCDAKNILRQHRVSDAEINNLVTLINPTLNAPAA